MNHRTALFSLDMYKSHDAFACAIFQIHVHTTPNSYSKNVSTLLDLCSSWHELTTRWGCACRDEVKQIELFTVADSRRGWGVNHKGRCQPIIWPIVLENCLKDFGSRGGASWIHLHISANCSSRGELSSRWGCACREELSDRWSCVQATQIVSSK